MKWLPILLIHLTFSSIAQLPSPELVRELGIKKMDVWHHELPPIVKANFTLDSTKDESLISQDTTSTLSKTWFFNENGWPSGNIHVSGENTYESIYRYDSLNRLIERTHVKNDEITFSEVVIKLNNGQYEYMKWRDGVLQGHQLMNPDSLIVFVYPVIEGQLPYYIDDRDSSLIRTTRYENNELYWTRTDRWILNDSNVPVQLEVDFQQFKRLSRRNKRPKSHFTVYPVLADGSAVSVKERVAPRVNYYTRGEYSQMVANYEFQEFYSTELLNRTEDVVHMTFTHIDPVSFRSFKYYYDLNGKTED